jgi:hypothetical protein
VTDERLGPVRDLLAREGMGGEVCVAGPAGEILTVRARPEEHRRLARLAPEIRAAGFRYVTIELDVESP